MAHNFQLATATQNAACNAVVDLIDGASAGTIKIYDGTQPANANTAVSTQNLLATITLKNPAFGNSSAGVATLDVTGGVSTSASATGTATWFRCATSGGNTVFDGSVGTSGADLNLSSTSVVSGTTVSITSGTVTMPAS
jgi:hypothetical protein